MLSLLLSQELKVSLHAIFVLAFAALLPVLGRVSILMAANARPIRFRRAESDYADVASHQTENTP
jgi:hypothetical protein